MNKNFTLLYVINEFEKNASFLADTGTLFSIDDNEYEDVIEFLNKSKCEPRQEVIDKIFDYLESN
ncbi:MAG: hypothetical protein HN704_06640 [Bacteroidetes bacterium]|jgi:hypothetical protein|nr:hypothetical protein [Bacteroidota bacterium]MBT6686198.1 hypothetical protein [Bacteroidota bacterium]MBT7143909.1 hypothetical protein [Bacteroidota bacterium]MBT7491264.1 hypothetical protein [Bacteroidota bacterium]